MRVVAQPLIAVADVEASSRYCHLLGGTSGHGGREYERVVVGGDFVLQLHDWNVHEHQYLGDEKSRPWGNGALLSFCVDDLDGAGERAHDLGAEILEDRHPNPGGPPRGDLASGARRLRRRAVQPARRHWWGRRLSGSPRPVDHPAPPYLLRTG